MNRTVARDETKALWHVYRGSSLWSPDLNVVSFIQCNQRRGTSPPAIIHAPNYKTQPQQPTRPAPTRVLAIDHQTQIQRSARKSDHLPPDTTNWSDARIEKNKDRLFRRVAVFSIETDPQESTRPTLTTPQPKHRLLTPSRHRSGWRRMQGPTARQYSRLHRGRWDHRPGLFHRSVSGRYWNRPFPSHG
jgi:hypothetical protein